jgi:hypothetical protein
VVSKKANNRIDSIQQHPISLVSIANDCETIGWIEKSRAKVNNWLSLFEIPSPIVSKRRFHRADGYKRKRNSGSC